MVAAALLTIERWIWFASCVLSAVLAARLFLIKLSLTYRFFLASLAFTVVRMVVMWPLDIKSPAYWTFWMSTEPVTWLFSTLVVLELCSLIFKDYRGIQLLSRRTVYVSLADLTVDICGPARSNLAPFQRAVPLDSTILDAGARRRFDSGYSLADLPDVFSAAADSAEQKCGRPQRALYGLFHGQLIGNLHREYNQFPTVR